jgi:hypothetical protein
MPDYVIGFFNLPNPSSCTMALGSTQPLREMSTRNLPGDKGWPMHESDNLTAMYESTKKCGRLDISEPDGSPRPVTGIVYLFTFLL